MVHKLRCLTTRMRHHGCRVAGELTVVLLALLCLAVRGWAQEPAVHYWHQGVMPPGAIGSRQLQRGGPLAGFFQPVEIKAPPGVSISLAVANQFGPPQQAPRRVGLLIGSVYRLRVTNIPFRRPKGWKSSPRSRSSIGPMPPRISKSASRFPWRSPQQDIELAMQGKYVTRVIYLEDPHNALSDARRATASRGSTCRRAAIRWRWPTSWAGRWRSSALAPACPTQGPDPNFFFGSPPWVAYPPRTAGQAKPVRETAPARPAAPAEKKPQP